MPFHSKRMNELYTFRLLAIFESLMIRFVFHVAFFHYISLAGAQHYGE